MLIPLSINKTGETEYMGAKAEEMEIFETFKETPKAITTPRTMAFEVADLQAKREREREENIEKDKKKKKR
jgi:hypothetical protein